MKNSNRFCQLLLTLIRDCPQDIVFFVGAGISRTEPACLPLAKEVKLELLARISINTPRTKLGEFYEEYEPKIENLIDSVFMESVFEMIRIRARSFDDRAFFEMIAEIFKATRPNKYHLLLAQLVLVGCSVVTTNFDRLIENALNDPVVTRTNLANLRSSTTDRILHIHGSISDPASIITTLRQVGRGLPQDLVIALREVLKNKIVIFVGWSDHDIDITPVLFMTEMQTVHWIKHDEDQDLLLASDELRNSDDFADRLISQFNGLKYIGSTPELVHDLWNGLRSDTPPERSGAYDWKKPIERLLLLDEWERAFILLEILERIDATKELPDRLIRHLEHLFQDSCRGDHALSKDTLAELYCKKSVCKRIIHKFEDAIESAKKGKETLEQEEHFSWLIELNNDIASAYNDWGHHERNVEMHEKAVRIFGHNLDLINERLEGEIDSSTRVLLLLDKAQVHTNLGSTYSELYETARCRSPSHDIFTPYLVTAEKQYRKGIRIHENIAKERLSEELEFYNNIKLGDLHNNIANVFCILGKKNEAKHSFRLCLEYKEKAGDINGRTRALGDYLYWFQKENDADIDGRISNEYSILRSVVREAPVSSTHLLYYKKRLVEGGSQSK